MTNRYLVGIGCLILGAGSVQAEESIPNNVKAKVNGYVGTWQFAEEVKESPSAEPIKVTGEWKGRWIFESLNGAVALRRTKEVSQLPNMKETTSKIKGTETGLPAMVIGVIRMTAYGMETPLAFKK